MKTLPVDGYTGSPAHHARLRRARFGRWQLTPALERSCRGDAWLARTELADESLCRGRAAFRG